MSRQAQEELVNYLNRFRVKDHRRRHFQISHTGMNNSIPLTLGRFQVPDDQQSEFIEQIGTFIWRDNLPVGLAEQHQDRAHNGHANTPLVIDLDMRQDLSVDTSLTHRFTLEQVSEFVALVCDKIAEVWDPDTLPDSWEIQAFTRGSVSPLDGRPIAKDGIHIFSPDLVTEPELQQILRNQVLPHVQSIFPLEKQGAAPGFMISEFYDKKPIEQSGMLMFGCTKKNERPQEQAAKFTQDLEDARLYIENEAPHAETSLADKIELMKRVSIRHGVTAETTLRIADNFRDEYTLLKAQHSTNPEDILGTKPVPVSPIDAPAAAANQPETAVATTAPLDVKVELIKDLVDCLSPERATDQESWVRVGWCLRNIAGEFPHLDEEDMWDLWIQFSAKSEKYVTNMERHDGWRQKYWNIPKNDGRLLRFGSLKHWAKSDNIVKQGEIHTMRINDAVRHVIAKKGTHTTMAELVREMQGQEFKCASIKEKVWYQFRPTEHRWVLLDSATSLRYKVSTEVCALFEKELEKVKAEEFADFQRRQTGVDQDQVGTIKMDTAKSKPVASIVKDLETTTYLDNLIKECSHKFQDPVFQEQLDNDEYMFAFKNGVIDLRPGPDIRSRKLRPGRPEDMISLQAPIDLIPYDEEHECIREARKFMGEVFYGEENTPVLEQMILILATCFRGGNFLQEFQFLNGNGANGKSVLMDIMSQVFGKGESGQGATLNVAAMMQKRGNAQGASPEFAKLKGKRFVKMEEPDEGKEMKINTGIFKEWTGGSDITARALYSNAIEFKPLFKMFFSCNEFPQINGEDPAVWRRARVLEFMTKFVNEEKLLARRGDIVHYRPRDSKQTQQEFQKQLAVGMASWMWHVQKNFFTSESAKPTPPEKVLAFTRSKQHENNIIVQFLDECITDEKRVGGAGDDDEHLNEPDDNAQTVPCTRDDTISVAEMFREFRTWQEAENGSRFPFTKKDFKLKIWNELRTKIIDAQPGKKIQQSDQSNVKVQPFITWSNKPSTLRPDDYTRYPENKATGIGLYGGF